MFKTKEEVIIIQAEAKEPIHTRAVFWSHDKGTAKMLFKLRKDGTSQSLAEGTIVPVVLDFNSDTAENGRGRHIYHAVIEDAVNGIVSIVLEDNILGYVGRVDGSIYIELPDSRSLDTAGRFTFHIKRSPIDEDVPELEDYYWQGFGDIMEQYHESIAEIKLEAKTTLDSLTADVNTAQNKVSQLEQSINTANTNLNARIDEISKKIDDNDVFTKAESSANVINQIIGKENDVRKLTLDLKGKVINSYTENLNWGGSGASNVLLPPSAAYVELTQDEYNKTSSLDTTVKRTFTKTNDYQALQLTKFNVLESIQNFLGEKYFKSIGATTTAEKIVAIKKIIQVMTPKINAFGTGPSGFKLLGGVWNGSSWFNMGSHSNSTLSEIKYSIQNQYINLFIDSSGYVYVLAYSSICDGTTESSISVDYCCLELTLNVSAYDHIESMIAQNHVENLATQTEATNATDNTKTMTPLRTKQLLDSKLLNMVYPIGSIYMSVNSATPATLFGGTWERFSKGRVLVGVDESDTVLATSGKQGGSTNGLTEHTHAMELTTYRVTSAGSGTVNNLGRSTDQGNATTGDFGTTSSAGDNTDHNNWQPFTTVYMWKRTA